MKKKRLSIVIDGSLAGVDTSEVLPIKNRARAGCSSSRL